MLAMELLPEFVLYCHVTKLVTPLTPPYPYERHAFCEWPLKIVTAYLSVLNITIVVL